MDLSDLNPAQKKAVVHTDGKVLILAGAGSGKTRVLTKRIAYLIQDIGAAPSSILGLTFTRKAADEMRERLGKFVRPKEAKEVTLATFHSFAMQILRREIHHLGYTNNFTLYDRQDVERVLRVIARDILEHEGALPSLAHTMNEIAKIKNRGVVPESEGDESESKWHDSFLREMFFRLNDAFRAHNACDFDHLLWLLAELFEKHPAVLTRYQEKYRYVMIDEYQDTNPIQAKIAHYLTKESQNLCVVGDDDQSIYSWRGADVNNILSMDGAKVITLEQNFRSTNTILRAANAVIHCNKKRHKKALWSDCGDGSHIELFHAPTEEKEAEAVVFRLLKIKKEKNLAFKDFAILYRSNSQSRVLETALMKHGYYENEKYIRGIPYEVYGGDEFFDHKEVKDLLGYFRTMVNPKDQEALLRIVNYPRRGIGEKTLDQITTYQRANNRVLWNLLEEVAGLQPATHDFQEQVIVNLSDKAVANIKGFVETMSRAKDAMRSQPIAQVADSLITELKLHQAIDEEVKSEPMRAFKRDNLRGLISTLSHIEATDDAPSHDPNQRLVEFLGSMMVDDKYRHGKSKKDRDHVHLMTFHSAKGLEFECCFLVGLEDHLIPHEKSIQEGNIEEERRLMYVAMTRAKCYLKMSLSGSRRKMGEATPTKPSRFLFEIPKEALTISAWDGT